MNYKVIIYVLSTILVFLALDGVNINRIFKQGKVFQARLFYFIVALSLIYLLTNFIYDFISVSKIL